ncbi:MAG: autoinducer binding domain-containing protein [Pseudomonadota bacterium]
MDDQETKIRDYQFDEFALGGFFLAYRVEFLRPEFEYNSLPRGWVHKYTQQGFVMLDPVMRWLYSNSGTIRWGEIEMPDTSGIFKEAMAYDLNFGVAISILDENESGVRSFGNFARGDREFTDDEIKELTRRLELLFGDLEAPKDITDAELEALAMLKNGMLIKEVAHELGISEGAVKQRLRSAKDKLSARTTPHAVSVASSYGLI